MISNFRPATPEDCRPAAELINEAFRGDSSRMGWTTEADLLDGLRTDAESLLQIIRQPDKKLLLAFDDESNLVGCVLLERRSENRCYLGMFTVRPRLQAAGLGKLLLQKAEEFARVRYGSTRMEMTVITAREELLGWYERRGYDRTGKLVPFPRDPRFGILKVPSLEMEVLEKTL